MAIPEQPLAEALTPTPVEQPGFFNEQELPPVEVPQPVDPLMFEEGGTDVAGIFSKGVKKGAQVLDDLIGIGKKGPVEPKRLGDVLPPGQTMGVVDDKYFILRETTPEEVDDFYRLTGKTSGVPSPTAAQRAAGIPTAEFNLEKIEGPDDLKQTVDKVSEIWREWGAKAGRGVMTHEEIMEMAAAQGLDKVVNRLMKGSEGFKLSTLSEDIAASLQAITSSGMELNRLAKIAATSTDDMDLLKFRQHMSFHAALQANMKGVQTEVGRALGTFRIPRSGNSDRAVAQMEGFQQMMNDLGGAAQVRDMAKAFLALPTQGARNKMSKNGFSKTKDAWFEIWVNGLLSAPQTHIVNMMSNTIMQIIQVPERFVAGMIGAGRQALGSNTERVFMGEGVADMMGMVQGMSDGWRLAGEAWRTEAPVRDLAGKIESSQRRAISSSAFGLEETSIFGKAVDYTGAGIRLPGRALMTEDEFFKAVAYRRQLNSLAYRRGMEVRQGGGTTDDVRMAISDVLDGTDERAVAQAQEFSQEATFTDPVKGKLGEIGAMVQSTTIGRLMVPFFRTPVKLTNALLERSPLGFIKAIKHAKDPVVRDTLIARATLGSSAMGYAAMQAAEGRITGTGPSDPDMRRQLESMGWKRWSIVVPKVDKPRWISVGHSRMLHPDDVDYMSYHRLEPVSMLLAIAADVSQRINYPTASDQEVEDMFWGSVDSVFDYLKDQTFLQGLSNIASLINMGSEQARAQGKSLLQNVIGSQVPYSSLLGTIERMPVFGGDPRLPAITVDRTEPAGLREVYAGLERLNSRLPLTDKDGPVLKDRFGNPRLSKNIEIYQAVLPPFIADILGDSRKKIESDPVLFAVVDAGVPLKMPERKIAGVRLTAEEYDRLLEFSNAPTSVDGSPQTTFYDAMKNLISGPSFKNAPIATRQTLISNIDRQFKSVGRLLLLNDDRYESEFFDLREKVRQQEKIREQFGRQAQ